MKPSPFRLVLTAVGVLLWIMIVLGLYFWVHKPFNPALVEALGGSVLDLAVAGLFVAAGGGMGRRALRRVDLGDWSTGEHVAAQAIVGLSLLSLAIFAVGAVSLTWVSMAVLLAVWMGLSFRDMGGWLRDLAVLSRDALPSGGWLRFVSLVVIALSVMALVIAVLPPSQWDTLTYHLYGPARYVDHGRFFRVPDVHFLGFPQLVETLYAGQVALTGRLTASAALHWAMGALLLLMTGSFTARRAGRIGGWVAASTLVVGYTVWLEMSEAYVDLMLMAVAIVMVAVIERWHAVLLSARDDTGHHPAYLVLLGVLAGWAMGTKYTAIWLAISMGVLILWVSRRDGWRAAVMRGAIYTAAAMVILAPWLVRNVIWYHNPVYPMFFAASDMDALRVRWYAEPGTGLIATGQTWHLPLMPITATFFGVEGGAVYQADIGPLFALLVPLLLASWRQITAAEKALVARLMVVVGVTLVAWVVTAAFGSFYNAQTRLVFFVLPLWAILSGIAIEGMGRLPSKPLDIGFIVRAMLAVVLALTLVSHGRDLLASGAHLYFSGDSDYRAAYLDHALGWTHTAMQQVNAQEPGTSIWFLWEPRGLYCDEDRVNCRVDSALDLWVHARRTVGDGTPAAIAESWQTRGAQMLLVFESGRTFVRDENDRYTSADWDAWEAFVRDHLVEVWRGGSEDEPAYVLYRWAS